MSRQDLYFKNGQKCIFWVKIGHFWAKSPNFLEGSKSFGTHFSENYSTYCFWSGMAPNGPQKPVLGQKCQFFCLGNPIFVNGTLVALCVTTIARIGPIKISLFVSICRAWCSVFFLKIWTLSHCGTLSVKHTGWIKQAKWNIHKAGTSKVLKTYTLQ